MVEKTADKVTKDLMLGEVVHKFPEAIGVMLERGLHCIGCGVAALETVEQGAKAHVMTYKQIEEMLKEINQKIAERKTGKEK